MLEYLCWLLLFSSNFMSHKELIFFYHKTEWTGEWEISLSITVVAVYFF